jgi:hypothetical protein
VCHEFVRGSNASTLRKVADMVLVRVSPPAT